MKSRLILTGFFIPILFSNSFNQDNYFKAIEKENLKLFNKELIKGSDINFQRKNDLFSPLLLASKNGKMEFVRILLDNGADLELRDKNGNTALIHAIDNNHFDIVVQLMKNLANIKVENNEGLTALHIICYKNNTNNNEVHTTQMNLINDLLLSGISVNDTMKNGLTPVIFAAKCGNLEVVKLLIEKSAIINVKSVEGATPLGQAANMGHLDIVKFLLANGADINIKCQNERTPLILSIQNKKYNVSDFLISQNADIAYITPTGFSALKAAIVVSNKALVDTISKKTNLTLDLDSEYDNELMASSIIYSNDNSIYMILLENEKNFKLALENKRLSDSLSNDSVKSKYYISQQINCLEKSYNCFAKREKEYRKQADRIEGMNTLLVVTGLALSAGMTAVDPSAIYMVSPTNLKNPELLYRIADKYNDQMTILQGRINLEKLKL